MLHVPAAVPCRFFVEQTGALHTKHGQDLGFSFHLATVVYILFMAARHRMTQNNVTSLVEIGLPAVEGNP
jgi:hypothetical protein